MKREILTTKKYRKDLKTALKSSTFDIDVFRDVIEKLRSDIPFYFDLTIPTLRLRHDIM